MDTPAPQSFIPKKPINGTSVHSGGAALGMFFVLVATLVFLASLFAAGGAFVYQTHLTKSIADNSAALQQAQAAFDPATIEELQRLDLRLINARALLQKHQTVLGLFKLLSEQTLQKVQFTSFSYTLQEGGMAQINLVGLADGFATVALQSDQLSANKQLKNVAFSSIVVNQQNGTVGFSVRADVDPAVLSYIKNLSNSTSPQATIEPPTTATNPALVAPMLATTTPVRPQ